MGLDVTDISVELVFAVAPRQVQTCPLTVTEGCTVAQALMAANWTDELARLALPATDARHLSLAIWGRKATMEQPLRDGDRIELCRPLRVDPKVARRERFQRQGAKAAGLFASRRAGSKPGY